MNEFSADGVVSWHRCTYSCQRNLFLGGSRLFQGVAQKPQQKVQIFQAITRTLNRAITRNLNRAVTWDRSDENNGLYYAVDCTYFLIRFEVDSVKHHGRVNDNHPGRLAGMIVAG